MNCPICGREEYVFHLISLGPSANLEMYRHVAGTPCNATWRGNRIELDSA